MGYLYGSVFAHPGRLAARLCQRIFATRTPPSLPSLRVQFVTLIVVYDSITEKVPAGLPRAIRVLDSCSRSRHRKKGAAPRESAD